MAISLTPCRLEKIWVDHERSNNDSNDNGLTQVNQEESAASSVSLGDTHVWRENGDSNV